MHAGTARMGKPGPAAGRGQGAVCPGLSEPLGLPSPAQPELSTPLSTLITGTSRINSSTYFPVLFAATGR